MRSSIIGVVALSCVAAACHSRQSLYIDPGNNARSEKPARDSKAAKLDKATTTAADTEPRARPGA